MKINVYPCKPKFCCIKVGLKGVKLYRRVFVTELNRVCRYVSLSSSRLVVYHNNPTQRAHDVNITSPQRRCNVMTLHRR